MPIDYCGKIPEGFAVIELAPCKMLVFQSETYSNDDFEQAVDICMERIRKFNPEVYGYSYAYELVPKMQLPLMCWREYIELHPIKELVK